MKIIGLDLGNVNILTSVIEGMDEITRKGGVPFSMTPKNRTEGIPASFFYSEKLGIRVGNEAILQSSRPFKNRHNLLKRRLFDAPFTCDGREFTNREALRLVVQDAIRLTVREMDRDFHTTSNLVSLAYPAEFLGPQRKLLKEIVEQTTLEDGTKIQVVGTITEPAAAALDYLSSHAHGEKTVLVYDLGGGTFDAALVKAYPDGKAYADGKTYYYDCLSANGIAVGGADFDNVILEMILEEINKQGTMSLNQAQEDMLHFVAESSKMELSVQSETSPILLAAGIWANITITREAFEQRAKNLLQRTIDLTKRMVNDERHPDPDMILLTGGASQMPMVKEALEQALPQYKGRIHTHNPHLAVSYGAARFGTEEKDIDTEVMIQRTLYDYGIACTRDDGTNHVSVMLPEGTPIPYNGEYQNYCTLTDTDHLSIRIMEARKTNPNLEGYADFREILSGEFHFGRNVKKGTRIEARMFVDQNNVLHVFARDPAQPNRRPKEFPVTLKL